MTQVLSMSTGHRKAGDPILLGRELVLLSPLYLRSSAVSPHCSHCAGLQLLSRHLVQLLSFI